MFVNTDMDSCFTFVLLFFNLECTLVTDNKQTDKIKRRNDDVVYRALSNVCQV